MEGPVESLLTETFDQFRSCGGGRAECVVFWTGLLDDPERVDRVVQPVHTAGPGGYEIDVDWLQGFWMGLYEEGRTVRVQVHTHPYTAFHSATDDAYPVSQRAGFLSLVIPDFAQGAVSLEGAALYELGEFGHWCEADLESLREAA